MGKKLKKKVEKKVIADYIPCRDSRPCFARRKMDEIRPLSCTCLTVPYDRDGKCPFCKPTANITNGKDYSYPPTKRQRFKVWNS